MTKKQPGARKSRGPSRTSKDLIAAAKDMGFRYDGISSRGHLRFRREGCPLVTASATPGCPFALKNALADLRRSLAAEQQQ